MVDINASSNLEDNVETPWASFLYAASLTHCMSVSLGQGGDGLGTVWGVQTAERMLREAGFVEVVRQRARGRPVQRLLRRDRVSLAKRHAVRSVIPAGRAAATFARMPRSAKDFFRPLAVGAPEPLREIPARPSRAIHFFDPSNEKMAAKIPDMVGTVDVLLGNLEDAVKADNKVAAREGLVRDRARHRRTSGPTQLWTRINSLDSPWVLDDLTTLVPEIGDKLDVIMVPKVQGAEDIHYVDRLLAQLEAKAGLDRPILVHAILETARGVANVEEICGASPRMQGLSLGPADLAADRRMKTTRVGGGHPGYLVRQDPPPTSVGVAQYRGQPGDVPAGPLALHDRPDGRRVRDARHLPLLRAVRRHRRRRRVRGPVPQRVPARLRRHLEPAPQADRDRQPGLLPQRRGRRARPPGRRRDGRRHRRGDARRQDGGRRLAQAVPGDGRARRAARRDRPRAEGAVRRHRGDRRPT